MDFPAVARPLRRGVLSPYDGPVGDYNHISNGSWTTTTGAWTANRAVYAPVLVDTHSLLTQIVVRVQTAAGNVDAGIYSWDGRRIVSLGSTACPAAGVAVLNIADTWVRPGWHWLAFASDSGTAIFRQYVLATTGMRCFAFAQQTSAFPLPDPITPATYAVAQAPVILATYQTTAI